MMKRCRFLFPALVLLLLGLAPAVSAMPGDCFSTCDVTAPCGTQSCQDCVWPYSDTECIQWGYAECQWYGLCGQTVCSVVREYDTYTAVGNWQYVQTVCYDKSQYDSTPPAMKDEYAKKFLKKHYRVTSCNGVETTELVYESYVYDHCYKHRSNSCSFYPTTNWSYPSCPF